MECSCFDSFVAVLHKVAQPVPQKKDKAPGLVISNERKGDKQGNKTKHTRHSKKSNT